MEISTAQLAVQIPQPQAGAPAADAEQISAFTRMLSGQNAHTPEQQVVERFQHLSQQVNLALASARDSQPALASPLDMLATQSTMLRSIIEVELMAKTVGVISQGVNKLVNMQ